MARGLDEILKPTRRFIARIELPHVGNGNGHRNGGAARIPQRVAQGVSSAGSSIRDAGAAVRSRAADVTAATRGSSGGSATGRGAGTTATGLRSRVDRRGGVAAGAAAGGGAAVLAYLFDPRHGARRRALLRDRFARTSTVVRRGTRATARDATNRTRGALASLRSSILRAPVDDVVLVERVRARLGRVARYPGAIDVAATNGQVTLSGPVLSSDAAAVRAAVRGTPGVTAVDDGMTEHASASDVPGLHGPGRTPETSFDFAQRNWAPTSRLFATVGGGGLVAYGIARRGVRGTLAALLGAGFVLRAATNLELGRALGLAGGRRAVDVHKSIVVGAPVNDVFAIWSRFGEFPRFMSHVRTVETNADGTYRWHVAGPAGVAAQFTAEVTKLVPNETIAWKSIAGEPIRHSGIVQFAEADGGTRITVRMTYNPPAGVLGHAVNSLFGTDPKTALDDDLLRFKSLVEGGTTTADGREATSAEIAAAPPSVGTDADTDAGITTPLGARDPGDAWTTPESEGLMRIDDSIAAPVDPGAPVGAAELTEPAYPESFTEVAGPAVEDPIADGTAIDAAMDIDVDTGASTRSREDAGTR